MLLSHSSKWMYVFGASLCALTYASHAQISGGVQQVAIEDGKQELVPAKVVEFKPVETDPGFELPAITTDYPHCLSDGSLVIRSVDWQTLKNKPKGAFPKYNDFALVVQGKNSQTVQSAKISDLTDFNVTDMFPADAGIYFLVQGSKEQPGERGTGKSPAGIPWKDYHNYVARFDLSGTFKGSIQLGTKCDISLPGQCELRHLAVFPSGDMLVTESDPATSTLKLLYLKSSGEVVKQIDVPASRKPLVWGDSSSNPQLHQAAEMFLGSVYFTAVDQNIVVWRANSSDPVVEVRDGGGVREVPIQIPNGYRVADLVASNDRWVVHFRTENTPPNVRMSEDSDAYFEVRPQDGSLSAKLSQKGDAPQSIACESGGTYTSFKMDDAGKMVLLAGK